jgi:hypothetical protein
MAKSLQAAIHSTALERSIGSTATFGNFIASKANPSMRPFQDVPVRNVIPKKAMDAAKIVGGRRNVFFLLAERQERRHSRVIQSVMSVAHAARRRNCGTTLRPDETASTQMARWQRPQQAHAPESASKTI